jgi:asparagine synthase (glutamine-hydrolysing)
MANVLLRDADVFGMAHGLEIRVPLLDRRVVDFGCTLAGPVRVDPKGPNKRVLVEALGRLLPPAVAGQRKRGFTLPHGPWMAGPLRELFEHLLGVLKSSGLVEPAGVAAVWEAFLGDPHGPGWSHPWILGVLGSWYERFRKNSAREVGTASKEEG